MSKYTYPTIAENRGSGFWMKPANIWASRTSVLRRDHTVKMRDRYDTASNLVRTVQLSKITGGNNAKPPSILILGDTGEGDKSQYALLPLIRKLQPSMIIINGDVAYPAGNFGDFYEGLFRPYQNLNVPIWATPGNHEYYSEDWGETLYELFCTQQSLWPEYGLVQRISQPGMYWEIREPSSKISVIGLDTGMHGNVTGKGFLSAAQEDRKQVQWLLERLKEADREGYSVVMLMHIPDLTNGDGKKANVAPFHMLAAKFNCVRAFITAHEHNFQYYSAGEFKDYLKNTFDVDSARDDVPYFVSGCGGAALHPTNTFDDTYKCEPFPTPEQWNNNLKGINKIVDKAGAKSIIPRGLHQAYASFATDMDAGKFLSLIVIEMSGQTTGSVLTPYHMEDVNQLIADRPELGDVDVTNTAIEISKAALDSCKKPSFTLT